MKMADYQYFLPTKIIFGSGSLTRLREIVSQFKPKKILLVAGEHLKKDGTVKKLIAGFKELLVYEKRISKSSLEAIDELASFCQAEKPDLIIAIGGGTILDTAKAAAILANNPGSVRDYVVGGEKEIARPGVPVVAIPTTSGTGSEVTPFAVVWDTKNKKKLTLASDLAYPKVALVDPELTDNLPPEITANTGIDALAQAIESYWAKKHNPTSDIFALRAVKLIMINLEKAVNNPDRKSREMMAQGSLFAGLAFSNTATTICHAVSYPITIYWDVPHGQAVAITLPSFIEYSLSALKERKAPLLIALGVKDEKRAAKKVASLIRKAGLATKLSQLGIKKKDIQLIVDEGFHLGRAGNAPKVPTPQELKGILEEIL